MVAAQAHRLWRTAGRPRAVEICEIGAGNGQLAADVLIAVEIAARRRPAWRRFARALRYRILERSPALVARQRETLGPLAVRVRWTRGDLARGVPHGAPFAGLGLVFGNEVLDCFAPHRVVPRAKGGARVSFVAARLDGRRLDRRGLARVMASAARGRVRFAEVLRPTASVRGLGAFLARHYPELDRPGPARPAYFACPQIEPFLANMARLYARGEAILIDYGDTRAFHLRAPERRRLIAGPPRSGASVFRDPGRDDITVMVDFSVVQAAARAAGWRVRAYGPQALLARGSGVRLDGRAIEQIVRARALGWILAASGVGPERGWRTAALTFAGPRRGRDTLQETVERDVAEFLGRRRTPFRLVWLASLRPRGRRGGGARPSSARARGRR